MHSNVRDELRRWLGTGTRAVDVLSEEDLAELHRAFTSARVEQARALARASAEAERQLPAVLRGRVARMLGG